MLKEAYIFGYGSLISADSRARTGHSGEAYACIVSGVQREWNLVAPQYRMVAVGAVYREESKCNGVVVAVGEVELPKFDAREEGYSRKELDRLGIILQDKDLPIGDVWTYVVDLPGIPSEDNPIVQSYVDVILTACFDYGEEFARTFVKTTKGWENPWINDRKEPRYPRAMSSTPLASKIDSLLKELIPGEFSLRG